MKPIDSNTVDGASASIREAKQSVATRIKRRKVILYQWLEDGIPMGKRRDLPDSLRAAQSWDDPELGILRIASPNEFSQNHPIHGADVREIARLLAAIEQRYTEPKRTKPKMVRPAKFNKDEADRQLREVVSQWHAERHARFNEERRANGAEQKARIILQENAELRRKLSVPQGLKIVE